MFEPHIRQLFKYPSYLCRSIIANFVTSCRRPQSDHWPSLLSSPGDALSGGRRSRFLSTFGSRLLRWCFFQPLFYITCAFYCLCDAVIVSFVLFVDQLTIAFITLIPHRCNLAFAWMRIAVLPFVTRWSIQRGGRLFIRLELWPLWSVSFRIASASFQLWPRRP